MGRRRRFLTAALALLAVSGWLTLTGRAQETHSTVPSAPETGPTAPRAQETAPSTTASTPHEELPAELLARLRTIEDFTYGFDHPAYYALFEFVKRSPFDPGFASPPLVVDDWQQLVERPSDFRGLPITISGVIGRNKDPYTHPRHPELGQAWQVELLRSDQAASCTVIFANSVSDLPIGATIRVTGYFVQVYRYPTKSQQPGLAALLVARGPTLVSRDEPALATRGGGPDWRWITAAIVAALLVTFLLLRRSTRTARRDLSRLRARQPAPINLADDLADWAQRQAPETDEPNRER
jgi:hypothetical protein